MNRLLSSLSVHMLRVFHSLREEGMGCTYLFSVLFLPLVLKDKSIIMK